ncbi:hypothetical protein EZV62_013171 [Acer yangbiense]|uniref:Protein BIG GRAIN 1-like A n=1 Tax=Acer yangbiense TaxID=1000413 RepID=A0A5C7HYB9_9ROSI|nr:hypothetical protein EZV62_013171 [Acer yangbiense]
MIKREKITREDRYKPEKKNPSFSSTLLDEIYRSTDDGTAKSPDLRFYRETMQKKQSKNNTVKSNKTVEVEQISSHRRACLIDKWMDKKVSEKAKQFLTDYERKSNHHHDHDHDHDQDAMFFSSTSSSSDSSSAGFSSSDTDSLYGSRSWLVPSRPKPVRTSVSAQAAEKPKKTERTLFYEQRQVYMFDDYNQVTTPKLEESLIKSKSRALKIYSNLKKVKQPISPGGRLASFINSLFSTTGNTKKPKNPSSLNSSYDDVINAADNSYAKSSGQVSTCSSTSSFSRSCLSKNSPSTRERLRNGVKRSVRFYPVSVIVDEDCRPCGHKSLYEEEDVSSNLMSVSVPTAWKIGKSPSRKKEEELKLQVKQRIERVILKDHQQNQKKNDAIMRNVRGNYEDEDDEDDDAASCSSSDLFELDHLSMIGNNNRYCEELPVYETTHVHRNRAIANGLIM